MKRDQRVEKRTGKIQMVVDLCTGHGLTPVGSLLTSPSVGWRAKVRTLMGYDRHSLITEWGEKKRK